MSGMNHLILYTLSCGLSEEEKSINASEIFSKQILGLWKPFRSGFLKAALSVFLKVQAPEAPTLQPLGSFRCLSDQPKLNSVVNRAGRYRTRGTSNSRLVVTFSFVSNNRSYKRDSANSKLISPDWTTFFWNGISGIVKCPLVFIKLYRAFSSDYEIKCPLLKNSSSQEHTRFYETLGGRLIYHQLLLTVVPPSSCLLPFLPLFFISGKTSKCPICSGENWSERKVSMLLSH